jgi:TonB-linked SusC/RagA family outer membrane protein
VSAIGGDDKTRYLISGGYTDQDGILINTGYNRYSGRLNFDRDLLKGLNVGISLTGSKSTQNGVAALEAGNPTYQGRFTNPLGYALRMPPVVPIYNADGSGYHYKNPYEKSNDMTNAETGANPNPISDMNNSVGQNINSALLGNVYAQYTIIDGLVAKAAIGTNFSNTTQNFFSPASSLVGLLPKGIGGVGNKRYEAWHQEYTINFARDLADAHTLSALAGYTTQNTSMRYASTLTGGFTKDDLTYNDLYAGNSPDYPRSGGNDPWLRSVLGRINYTLLGRYNLTATLRADESSRFAPGHRWGYFPSVGVSWNVNEEAFLKGLTALNTLKLRLTYGSVGNQEIADNLWAANYSTTKTAGTTVYSKIRKGNPDLKWETTVQYNLGVDVGLWNGRLSLVADAYYKKTNDLLYNAPLDPSEGFSSQMVNVGNVTNKGVELSLNTTIVDTKALRWSISANIARNINEITDLGSGNQILTGGGLGVLSSNEMILRVGSSLNSFYGLVFDGVVQTGDNLSTLPTLGWLGRAPQPGDPKFVDADNNGTIDYKDRVIIGKVAPDFAYGFSTSAIYKGVDLFISLQGSEGNNVYNRLHRTLGTPNGSYNASTELLGGWTESNPSQTVPRVSQDIRSSYLDSRFIEDASYLRLKNITLGYTLPVKIVRAATSIAVRVFASAQNLLTVTGYKGYDPEVENGYDTGVYPRARTFSVGASVAF